MKQLPQFVKFVVIVSCAKPDNEEQAKPDNEEQECNRDKVPIKFCQASCHYKLARRIHL